MSSIRYGAGNSPREVIARKNAAKAATSAVKVVKSMSAGTALSTIKNYAPAVTSAAKSLSVPVRVATATNAGVEVINKAQTALQPNTPQGNAVKQFIDEHPIISGLGVAAGAAAIGGAIYYVTKKSSSSSTGGSMASRRRINPANKRALMKAVSRLKAYDNMDRMIDKAVKKALGRRKS